MFVFVYLFVVSQVVLTYPHKVVCKQYRTPPTPITRILQCDCLSRLHFLRAQFPTYTFFPIKFASAIVRLDH
jgi:hypothetical protein